MNKELAKLKDIHLPQPINMWALAPGWILLAIILMCLISVGVYFWYKAQQKKSTIKFALAYLTKLQSIMIDNPNNINIAAEISTLIRRTALHYFPREQIAGLTGDDWLHFLNDSSENAVFTADIANLLTEVPYQKNNIHDLTPLFDVTKNWLISINKKKTSME